jgi:hypothetical protein
MFSDNTYSEVNREERFFCFLLGHALLMSRQVRLSFADLAQRKCNVILDPDKLEVFVEAAALRDYWRELGDPVVYSTETHERRKAVLKKIFEKFDLTEDILDKHDLFWTSTRKLWNPNHWNEKALAEAGLDKLIKVKWAFNAKPDMLLASPESLLVIEAKVESPEGCKADVEYEQFKTQKLIGELWQLLIPKFQNRKLVNAILKVSSSIEDIPVIQWSEIIDLISGSDVDEFTRTAMAQLNRYYKKKGG